MADKQINEFPSSPFTSGLNIACQKSEGGEGSTITIKSGDILSLIELSTDLRFVSTWDQPSFPPSPENGQFWVISSTGQITIDGVDYYPNDWLVYINSTVGWKKNPTNLSYIDFQIQELNTVINAIGTEVADLEVSLSKLLGALVFQGTWDASTNTTPTPPPGGLRDGLFWMSIDSGTVLGVNYAPNDLIIYIDSTMGWIKILNNVDFLQNQITSINSQITTIQNEISSINSTLSSATSDSTPNTIVKRDSLGASMFSDNLYIGGNNPYVQVSADPSEGPRDGSLFGSASANGSYFNEAMQYDAILRQTNISRASLLGVGLNANIKMDNFKTRFFKPCIFNQDVTQVISTSTGNIDANFTFYSIENNSNGNYI